MKVKTPIITPVLWLALILLLVMGMTALAQLPVVTHAELQAVNSTGQTAWVESFSFVIRGVIINDPEEMLDYSYDPDATVSNRLGGQYQMFFQGIGGDRGGTALWMAQNYQAMGQAGQDYGTEWTNEMRRIQYDANGRKFRKGDLIEVTARKALFRGGKRNINEAHRITESNDFDVVLVKANVGVPSAEPITLADLVNPDGTQIFDATRATGGEHWQGMRVRLDQIRLSTTNGWGKTNWADRICLAADQSGRTFPLRMPLLDLGPPKATDVWFSVTGIINQENSNTNGYELFVQEVGPELRITQGANGRPAVSFSSDYDGYVLQYSDDGLNTWADLDATPVKTIIIEDQGDSINRMYRLIKKEE